MSPRHFETFLNLIADALGLCIALFLIYWLKAWGIQDGSSLPSFDELKSPILVSWVAWGCFFLFTGMYRRWVFISRFFHLYSLGRNYLLGALFLICFNVGPDLLHQVLLSEKIELNHSWFSVLLLYISLCFIMTGTLRMFIQYFLRWGLRQGLGMDPILIISQDATGSNVLQRIQKSPELGYRVVGFVGSQAPPNPLSTPYLGTVDQLDQLIKKHNIHSVLISHESISKEEIEDILGLVVGLSVRILVIPDLYDVISGHFKASFVHDLNFKELLPHNMPTWQAHIKRFVDVTISILMLILTSPLLLATAIAIRLDSKGPILYSQERTGQFGHIFRIWKFRTMRTDAELAGPQWASKSDPRITRIGRFLRKTRIDEIPQFWCVLKGDMSIVGPRPERQHFIDQLKKEIPLYSRRLIMKPGITGWAQVRHTYDNSVDDVRIKLMYDLYYFENLSIFLDLQIMLRTILVVLTGKGAQ